LRVGGEKKKKEKSGVRIVPGELKATRQVFWSKKKSLGDLEGWRALNHRSCAIEHC